MIHVMFVTRVTFFSCSMSCSASCHACHVAWTQFWFLKVVPKNRGAYYAMATARPEPRVADWEGPTWKKTWKGDNNWNNKDWALHKIEVNFDEKSVTEHWRKDTLQVQLQKPAPPPPSSETSTVSKPEDVEKGGKGGGKRGLHKVDRVHKAAGKTTTMKKPGAKFKPEPQKKKRPSQASTRK